MEALKSSIQEISKYRSISATDGPLLGREVDKLFPSCLLVFVDNMNPVVTSGLERCLLANAHLYQKWDMQIHFIQIGIPPFRGEPQGSIQRQNI